LTEKCLLLENVRTYVQVTLAVREIGHKRMSGTYMTQNRTQWRVFCPRFGLTWPRIGHSDVYSVRDLFQSDTV